jgi:hypothetical protein
MQAAQNTAQIFLGHQSEVQFLPRQLYQQVEAERRLLAWPAYFRPKKSWSSFVAMWRKISTPLPRFCTRNLNRTPASRDSQTDRRAAAAAIFTDPRNGRLIAHCSSIACGSACWGAASWRIRMKWTANRGVRNCSIGWQATFVESHYDMRRLIATICVIAHLSDAECPFTQADTPKKYVFRGPEVRRITAEEFADAIGSVTGEWHVYQQPGPEPDPKKPVPANAPFVPPKPGVYTRDWRVASTSLTRALGRPIRDQVYSVRDNQPTTLQALELENGEPLTHWLNRGARKMLGELPPEPASLFDRPLPKKGTAPFEVDISHVRKLWLLVADTGSYSPEKVEALWGAAELVGRDKVTPLSSLTPIDDSGLRVSSNPIDLPGANAIGVRVKTPSRVVYDIGGKGYTKLRGLIGIENKDAGNDINPNLRFFIFDSEPNMERLTPVLPDMPVAVDKINKSPDRLVERLFWYALGRAPTLEEKRTAEEVLRDAGRKRRASADGLADLLWAILMKPEFQLIY